jgi:hypothetical protein
MSKYGFSVDNIVDAVVVDREPGVGGGGGGGGGGGVELVSWKIRLAQVLKLSLFLELKGHIWRRCIRCC